MDNYTLIIIITMLILLTMAGLVYENDRLEQKDKKALYFTCIVVALAALAEWVGVKIGGDQSVPTWAVMLAKVIDYCMTPLAAGILVAQFDKKGVLFKFIQIIITANIVLQLVAIPAGWMLLVDDTNHYHYGPLHPLYVVIYNAVLLLVFVEFALYGRNFRRQNRLSLYLIFAMFVFGCVTQELSGGEFRIAYLMLAIGMTLLFIHNTEFSQIALEDDMKKMRVRIVLSQIRPHFIFNCIAVIKETYRNDMDRGDEAISHFANYLRSNIDSLDSEDSILFNKELEHVKEYLELQKLRFGEKLMISYDLECTDFYIPMLTLQPVVENAVTHGIKKNKDGSGHICIQTKETTSCYEVSVSDDGPGFTDIDEKGDKSRSHVGINNVREHLHRSCGGTLSIDSVQGLGCKVTMDIPKNVGKEKQ